MRSSAGLNRRPNKVKPFAPVRRKLEENRKIPKPDWNNYCN